MGEVDWFYRGPLLAYRRRNGMGDRGDAAGLPFAWAILTGFLLVASPMVNRIIYAAEVEADMFGLDAAREPYGFATSAMRLGAYRKPEPGPLTNSCRNRPARGEGCSRWGQGRENPAMIRGQKSWGHSTGQGLPKHTDYVR